VIRSEVGGIDFLDDDRVRAGAGVPHVHGPHQRHRLAGLGGLHHYVGIPSTVGGAIWQNLHFLSPPPERERTCFIEEVVESAEILTRGGRAPHRGPRLLPVRLRLQHPARPRRRRAHVTFRWRPAPEEELRASCART
jgi:hypothetical protein